MQCDAKDCEKPVYHHGHWFCYRHYVMVKNRVAVQRK